MKPDQTYLKFLGLGLALTAALALWARQRPAPPEPVAKMVSQSGIAGKKGLEQWHHQMARSRALARSSALHRQNISLALATILAEPDSMRRDELIQVFADAVRPEEIPAAVATLQGRNQTESSKAFELALLRRWSGNDPQTAADWIISQMPEGEARREAINGVAIQWANRNLSEALAWDRRLPESEERQSALLNTAYEAARTAPTEALTVAAELMAGPARDDLITHAAMQWAAVAPEQAAVWAKQIADATLNERVLAAIATAWGARDPVAAANLAASLAPGRRQDDAVIGIVQRWVQKSPEAVTAWVNRFPEGRLRETAVAILANTANASINP